MIFEFADGGTLQGHLRKNFKNLTRRAKHKLCVEITNGLQYLHDINIIHKDLV